MNKYIDTHGHLNSKEFINDLEKNINEALEKNVDKIIVPGTTKKDSLLAIKMSKKYSNVYALAALHPSYSKSLNLINWLENINPKDIIGVGECGIDLYWKNNPPLKIQQEIFKKHLDYAKKHHLPVVVHTRNAEQETFDVIANKKYQNLTFIIHCNTMNKEWTKKFVDLGCYVSFSGIITFKKSSDLRESLKVVPLEKLLTETDAPYLAPEPVRGKMNKPKNVKYVTDFVASFLDKNNKEKIVKKIYENALEVFNIK